jgi:hypothetical protein
MDGLDEGRPASRASCSLGSKPPALALSVGPESITISANNQQDTFHISKRLDCGIAMLHLEVALQRCGLRSRWRFLEPPGVVRFQIDDLSETKAPLHPSSGSEGLPGRAPS